MKKIVTWMVISWIIPGVLYLITAIAIVGICMSNGWEDIMHYSLWILLLTMVVTIIFRFFIWVNRKKTS